jgi:ABC-type multidrug transport system fused ATPase/permease subunit
MSDIKKILLLLSKKEKKKFSLLIFFIFIMAFLEMIGVASILPFIAVLTNPSLIESNLILNHLFQIANSYGVENQKQFIFILGILVFILLIFSQSFKVFTSFLQIQFVQMREYSIGKWLLEKYLNQPYSWFLNSNSADLGKNILSEVQQVIGAGLRPLLDLIAKSVIVITLVILLMVVELKISLIISLSLIVVYLLTFYSMRKYMIQIAEKRLLNNGLRFKVLNEAFGGIKEVKISRLEKIYINLFSNYAKILAKTQTHAQIIGQTPRFVLEAIAFGGILLLMLYIISEKGSMNEALPILSLYVFAGYRLIPAFQQIYSSFTSLSFIGPSVNNLYKNLNFLKSIDNNKGKESIPFNKKITLEKIHFSYPKTSKEAVKNISLSIPVQSLVGFVGTTGSGKTTTIDIITGLLEPQSGMLKVDDQTITSGNVSAWQRNIGYVPQHIFLNDDTIEANIAFGVSPKDVDQNLVENAAKIANLHRFIIDELPDQYKTIVGERGVRLSGGQRQRIGIARALYHDPKILILDEATNALDNQTEEEVMKAIDNIGKKITIILIAHRMNTLKNCDKVFLLDKGELKAEGSLNEILEIIEKLKNNNKASSDEQVH